MSSETNFAFNGFNSTGTDPQILTQKIATTSSVGTVQPDGTTILVDGSGVISAAGGGGGGNIWPFTFTAPPSSGWSWQNQNVAGSVNTVDTSSNRIALTTDGVGDGIVGYVRNKVNALFTLTVGVTVVQAGELGIGASKYTQAGIILTDGTKSIVFGILMISNTNYVSGFKWTNATTPSAAVSGFTSNGGFGNVLVGAVGPILWLRVVETASNRKYYLSPDGLIWVLVSSTSNTDFLTTSKYGLFIRGFGSFPAATSMYSLVETTP